ESHPDASDEEIRTNYLRLVKEHTPEKDPDMFQKITEAYEAVKDVRKRVWGKLFRTLDLIESEPALIALAESVGSRRKRVGLETLFKMEKACNKR
ncbi:DnaJ domain-containing protein, partial [Desulfobacterales bacterium HSG16]|nr:DnaJ domain-containing protein [Desulfobacterales bacterium HSG16]